MKERAGTTAKARNAAAYDVSAAAQDKEAACVKREAFSKPCF